MKKTILILTVLFMAFQQTGCSQSASTGETLVLIKTSYGDITAKLYNDTPKHRDNFIKLIKEGWYEGSPFHRIISGFMIQGGGNKDGRQDPGYTVDAEFIAGHLHKKGALAAARKGDQVNPTKASSGSQFYIVQGSVLTDDVLDSYEQRYKTTFTAEQRKTYTTIGGTPWLDGGYTVFGEVVSGFDVIDKLAAVPTGPGDVPVNPVTMTISIIE
jgi:cyclophilin family peptidyl-prolyl cis-trans isomerase